MSLHILVAQERWQDFDQTWQEIVAADGSIDDLIHALHVAGEKKRASRCTQLARAHATQLAELGRKGDAARLLGAMFVAGGAQIEWFDELMTLATEAWSEEPWWDAYRELAGLGEAGAVRGSWAAFERLLALQPGSLVFHPGGWGAGEIEEVDPAERVAAVRFASGKRDRFPLNAAIEIFDSLPEGDLRAQYFRDPEGMRKRTKAEPLDALRAVLERHHGKCTAITVRNALAQLGIEGSAWTAWWRKARKLAENSEWFEVTGPPARAQIRLLLVKKDPVEALRRQLKMTTNLSEAFAKVKELFIGDKVDESVRAAGIEVLEELASVDGEPISDRVAAWLLVREVNKTTPELLTGTLEALRDLPLPEDPAAAPALWALFQELGSVRDHERALDVLPEVFDDQWVAEALKHLPHAPYGMVRLLVEELEKAGERDALRAHYAALLARPQRAPSLLVRLAQLFEDGKLEGDDLPTPAQRARALLSLAQSMFNSRRGDPHLTRVHSRLVEHLTSGDPALLKVLLEKEEDAGLRSLQTVLDRGTDEAIDRVITDIALSRDRHFFRQDMGPFWEGDSIWTTKVGLEQRSLELKDLHEVKIPENQDAIGRAASYGDLSENAEWEAAIEEQRNLTARAMEIESELRSAELIEEAALPEGVACPGTKVKIREGGDERSVRILGPWDGLLGDDVVSYLAPLAQGIMGNGAGDTVSVQLPSGEIEVDVLEVEPAELS